MPHFFRSHLPRIVALLLVLLFASGCLVRTDGPQVPTLAPLTPTPTVPPLPASTGRIAFRSERGGNPELWVVNPDGSNLQQVTHDTNNIGGTFAWSPDGNRLAYQAFVNQKTQVFVVNVGRDNKASGDPIMLSSDAQQFDNVWPAWSPDGSKIVFQSNRNGGNYQLFITSSSGGAATPVSTSTTVAFAPDWSPDGSKIVYVGGPSTDFTELYAVSPNGGTPQQLTNLGQKISRPLWSPDSKSIVFMFLDQSSHSHVESVQADGSGLHEFTGADRESRFPVWSPDSSKITYYSSVYTAGSNGLQVPGSNNEIYVVNRDGSGETNITNSAAGETYPVWSPDGLRLVFSSNRGGTYRLYTMGADGKNLAQLTSGDGDFADAFPIWGK